jgi:ABC-type sugar transport system substrate-binding protein
MNKRWQKVALIGAAGAMIASVAALAATPPGPSQIPKTGEHPPGAPQTVKRSWGTFKLNSKIAAKIKNRQPINYVFSYQASGIPLFSQQYKLGYQRGCTDGGKIYPLKCSSIAPVQTDPNQQVSQIETKLAAGQIDCISIEPATSDAMTAVTNKMMAQGIPVFTVGVTSRGHEFTNFTQVPLKEGATAANTVLAWMKATHRNLKVFMVSGGDPAQFWAQGRMKGFRQTILKAIPGAKFVNTESNALNTSYDPGKTYDAYKAFLSAHSDVQFIENVDIGAEHANRAIRDLKKTGKVFTIGWNVSKGQLDGISQNFQVAALDQRWADQAAFGGSACAQFLGRGIILGNTQTLRPITKGNVRQARAELNQVLKSGG